MENIKNVINAEQLVNMINSGANKLYNNRKKVDDLNVFPVPDGDTGTNMSMTVTAMAAALREHISTSVTKVADTASYATLRGARGNSGVILSQLFRGISKGLKGLNQCTTSEFAEALKKGVETAYKAVMNPTEGTILTVSREAAAGAVAAADDDFVTMLESAVTRGNKALKNTTNMLPALKQAGVVDAGGQGWMYILEGMLEYVQTGVVVTAESNAAVPTKKAQSAVSGDIKYMYCTEFIVEKKNPSVNVDAFRQAIKEKGDCMLVIDDEEIVKVHIHTNHPGFVLERAVILGSMINIKIDNMKHQHNSIISENDNSDDNGSSDNTNENVEAAEVAMEETVSVENVEHTDNTEKSEISESYVSDESKADTAEDETEKMQETIEPEFYEIKNQPEEPKRPYAIAAVCAGKGFEDILKDLGIEGLITGGQTMNPSTEDIINTAEKLNAETVYMFPNNKNIILAANQAKEILLENGINMVVIPTKSIVECISAMFVFNARNSADENEKNMCEAAETVKTGQITYAVRDTVIGGVNIAKGDILGINGSKIAVAGKSIIDCCVRLVSVMTGADDEFITIYYGGAINEEDAQKVADAIEERYPDCEVSVKYGGQPVYYYVISVE